MKQFILCVWKFVARAFDFKGRSTRLEYWSVVPLVWALIVITLLDDMRQVQETLLEGQIPELNPFLYPSFVIFFVTLIPRLSLNIRRLHDSGRSLIFSLVPAFCMFSVLVLVSGLLGAMMNSSLTGVSDGPDDPANIIYPVRLYLSSPPEFWGEVFQIAKVLQATELGAINTLVDEILAQNGRVNIRRSNTDISIGIFGDISHTLAMIIVYVLLLLTPVSSFLTHMVFVLITSNPKANRYGKGAFGQNLGMNGQPHLGEQGQSGTISAPQNKRQAEINSLYQKRVLGVQSG